MESRCHNFPTPNDAIQPFICQRQDQHWDNRNSSPLATEQELSDFLKSVERRAFKRSMYHVRDEDAALDIVQDSMMKLAQHYGDKPVGELPMLFQRILSNATLDWFRRRKTRNALFTNINDSPNSLFPENI
jgi:RNA polymerase sigma-70 factor (ECF subfamily)